MDVFVPLAHVPHVPLGCITAHVTTYPKFTVLKIKILPLVESAILFVAVAVDISLLNVYVSTRPVIVLLLVPKYR